MMKRRLTTKVTKPIYDLSLQEDRGGHFMVMIVCIMVFLAGLALGSNFILRSVTAEWRTGLTGNLTLEFPDHSVNPQTLIGFIEKQAGVEKASLISEVEIADMVRPWLGQDLHLDLIPLPILIDVELIKPDTNIIHHLKAVLAQNFPGAKLDDHMIWLNDLEANINQLRITGLTITMIILIGLFLSVAGSSRTKVALHLDEIEILHLMGATDHYIAKQFQSHAFFSTLKSAVIGLILTFLALFLLVQMNNNADLSLLPDMHLAWTDFLILSMTPVIYACLATLTTRFTVLRSLEDLA